jgi:4'-phosphopantetheinyl transferase
MGQENEGSMFLFQSLPEENYHLTAEHIDIWEFPLDQLPATVSSLLNQDEKAQANRFYFPRHRRRFAVARAMLRMILARYLQQSPQELIFDYNTHGKPRVRNDQHMEFNLSHSKDLALLAVGQHSPLGIDLEFFSSRSYEGIAKNAFSPREHAYLSKVPSYLKSLVFFHIWTQKEALIKACGLGLSYPTQQFEVPLLGFEQEQINDTLHALVWQVNAFMPKVACCAALCYQPPAKNINYKRVNPFDWLS